MDQVFLTVDPNDRLTPGSMIFDIRRSLTLSSINQDLRFRLNVSQSSLSGNMFVLFQLQCI